MKKSGEFSSYVRDTETFEAEFGVHPNIVIPNMDKNGDDIPYQCPEVAIEIPQAGVTRDHVPLHIQNPFDQNESTQLNARITLETRVPASHRGIHMSRVGNIIAEVSTKMYSNLQECAIDLAELLSESQYEGGAAVEITAPFSFVEEVIGWKDQVSKKSLETIRLSVNTGLNGEELIQNAGIEVSNITACPCVQQTYKHVLLAKGITDSTMNDLDPLLTHSQRCNTKVTLTNLPETLPIINLLKIIDNTVVRVQNTLPRDQELLMVYRAHKSPQFMEDVVRNLLGTTYSYFSSKYSSSGIEVTTKSIESIHDFDIHAKVSYSFAELKNILKK